MLLLLTAWIVSESGVIAQEPAAVTSAAPLILVPSPNLTRAHLLVPLDLLAAAIVYPSQIIHSAGFQSLLKSESSQADWKFFSDACATKLGLSLEQIERIETGLDSPALQDLQDSLSRREVHRKQVQQLQTLTSAMTFYHSSNAAFPSTDGNEFGIPGLSWRVHLLPYLGLPDLYQRFHLDEPWDSDHNKSLIEQMPELYESLKPGQKGHTSIHVLAGEGMPFSGDDAPELAAITDGADRTILLAIAGEELAEIWTKPGALKIDGDARQSLGKVGVEIPVGFMDGSTTILPSDMPEDTLRHLMNGTDGQGTRPANPAGPQIEVPGFAIRYTGPWNRDLFCQSISNAPPRDVTIAGHKSVQVGAVCILQPQPGFALIGSQKSVEAMLKSLSNSPGDSGTFRPIFIDTASSPDLAAVINLQAIQTKLTDEDLKNALHRILGDGPAKLTETASGTVQLTDAGRSMMDVRLTMPSETTAQQISELCVEVRQWLLTQIKTHFTEEALPVSDEWSAMLQASTAIAAGMDVTLNVPAPTNAESFGKAMEAPVAQILQGYRSEKTASQRRETVQRISQVAYTLRGVLNSGPRFPPVDGPFDQKVPGSGLSWRVHLLPFLGEESLYKKFRLDEAWDSDHNKALIPEMPSLYASSGTKREGRSALHVITGEKTPFGNPEFQLTDLTDGENCTVMLVEAGHDTMEIWTKPGGLKFRADVPKTCLGTITRDFPIAFFNGETGFLKPSIADRDFTRLIQHQDGEPTETSALVSQ